MLHVIRIMAALSEPARLKAFKLLADGKERCGCELMQAVGATQSRLSRHMTILKAAGLVVDRRDAQWVRYRRNPKLSRPVMRLVKAVLAVLEEDEVAVDD